MDLSDVCYSGTSEFLQDWIAYAALCDPDDYISRITKAQEIHSRTAMSECAGKLPQMERCLRRIEADDFSRAVLAFLLSEQWMRSEAGSQNGVKLQNDPKDNTGWTLAKCVRRFLLPKEAGVMDVFITSRGYERVFSILFPELFFAEDPANAPLKLDDRLSDILLGWDTEKHRGITTWRPEGGGEPSKTLLSFYEEEQKKIAHLSGQETIFLFAESGAGKHALLYDLAMQHREPLVFCDLRDDPQEALQTVCFAMRESVLFDYGLVIEGIEALSEEDRSELDHFLEQEIALLVPKLYVMADTPEKPLDFQWCARVGLHALDEKQRLAYWTEVTKTLGSGGDGDAKKDSADVEDHMDLTKKTLDPEIELASVADAFALSPGKIEKAFTSALLASCDAPVISKKDLIGACYEQLSGKLKDKARRIEAVFGWDDLKLKPSEKSVLKDICDSIRFRHVVMGDWGFSRIVPYGAGISCLFAGPPGTGKTMAAQVLANELSMELYRIDLSQVIDKYVGETEKHIKQIFDEAGKMSCILFFDEADAIFNKRVEAKGANERFANIESSLLLQCMEDYNGMSILATNNKGNMDPAFMRRFKYYLNFSEPGEEERLAIWQAVIPEGAPLDEEMDLAVLAKTFEFTGASIKNLILHAAYLAAREGAPIGYRQIIQAVVREMEKNGRTLNKEKLGVLGKYL